MNTILKNKTHRIIFIAVSIFVLSVCFRFWKLGSVPVGLYWDEVAMYVDAKTVAATGKDMHGNSMFQAIFPSYGDYKLPMYIWLASISFKLFGASDVALRLPSAISGVLEGIVLFFFLRELTKHVISERKSYLVSFLGWFILAVTPWSVQFSRTGFEGHVGQVLVTASVLCLFLSRKSKKWLILATILGTMSVYSYYSVRFVWPVLLISYVLLFELLTTNFKQNLKRLPFFVVCFVIWAVTLLPLYFSPSYTASQQFRLSTTSLMDLTPYNIQSNTYRQMAGNSLISKIIYHQRILQLKDLGMHFSDHLSLNYLFITGDHNLRHGTGNHGVFLIFTLPLLFSGCVYLIRKNLKLFLFLGIWWMIALLPASVPMETPHALRSLNALAPIIVIMSMGVLPIYKLLLSQSSLFLRKVIFSTVCLFIILDVAWFCVDYFLIYPQKSASAWQEGYKQIAQVLDEKESKYNKMWVNPQDDRFFLWYLAYTSISPQEIQALMKDKFVISELPNMLFSESSVDTTNTIMRPFFTITKYKPTTAKPNKEDIILDSYGQPKFAIRYYEK